MSFTDMFKGENGVLNIMLGVAVIGALAESFAPGLLDPIGGFVSEPLTAILNVYVLMFFIYTIVGEEKDAREILKKLMPILMIIIVAGTFFDVGINTAKYLIYIVLAPMAGKILKNLLQGEGLLGLGKKWGGKKAGGKAGDILDAMSEPEKKEKGGGTPSWDRTGVDQLIQMNALLMDLREKVSEFNSKKSDLEEKLKELAKLFRMQVAGNDKLNKKFDKMVKNLKKDFDKLSPNFPLVDPALKQAILDLIDPHNQDSLEAKRQALDPILSRVRSYYDTGTMISLKSDDIKKDITGATDLLKETKEQIKTVRTVVTGWV